MTLRQIQNNTGYFFLALFAIFIGLYPFRFIGLPYEEGLLGDKPNFLLESDLYLLGFYTHIFVGGLALIAGFSQFFKKLRIKKLKLHKNLGKIYVVAVLLSGLSGLVIAYFASGGWIPALGFSALAILWLYTTVNAYMTVKKGEISAHQRWMVRSYALCFAAVTLRIYLPSLIAFGGLHFYSAYKIVAWLCWVPNLLVAEFLIIPKLKTI